MRSNSQTLKLRDVIEIVIDNRGRNPKSYSDYGVPVIDNYLIVSEAEADLSQVKRYIDEHTYNTFIRKYISKGDVLMTLVGNGYGKVAITPEQQCIIIQNTIGLRCNKDNDNLYLYYLLKANREVLMNLNRGAAQPSIKVGDILDLEFTFPPLHIQQKIGSTLGDLDKKSSLNSQANQTLEQMAQAMFKSWFVDFDPVKAKMNGEQPEGMDATTASLFPEKLVESELGLIPEGWDAGTLSDVAKYCSARTSIDSICLDNYISTENMLADRKGVTTASKLPTAKMVAAYKTGDVLVSNIRPYFKKIWLAEGNGGRSNDVLGFESSVPNTDAYIMNLLYQDTFFEYMTRTSKGAKMPRGDKTAIMNWEIAVPPVELREAYTAIVGKFYKLIPENRAQNETLESLRDALLPKLLSGEIELGEVENKQR